MSEFGREFWKRKSLWQSLAICAAVYGVASFLFEPLPAMAVYLTFIWLVNPPLCKWLVYWEWVGELKKLQREYALIEHDFNKLSPEQKSARLPHIAELAVKLKVLAKIVADVHPDNLKKNRG